MTQELQGKTVLITGGTGGIGKATATMLAGLGARIIVTGRDPARGEAALQDIKRETDNSHVELLLADLSSLAEVRRLAREVLAIHNRLDVLINNVGGLYTKRWETTEGLEANFATNVLGPFLLTQLLLPLLRKSAPTRVVNVSGGMPVGKLDFDNLQSEKKYSSFNAYSKSKLANLLGTFELARRLQGSGVTVNAVYPGSADTAMTQSMTTGVPPIFKVLGQISRRLGVIGGLPEKAAVSSVRAASDPALDGLTGRYFGPKGQERRSPRGSTDEAAAKRLWAMCEQLTGLSAQMHEQMAVTPQPVAPPPRSEQLVENRVEGASRRAHE